jgi:hypothetical protein
VCRRIATLVIRVAAECSYAYRVLTRYALSRHATAAIRHLRAFSPQLQLETLFILNGTGRIVSTREPDPSPGPRFFLIRGNPDCAWATRTDVSDELADRVDTLAREEPPPQDFRGVPLHAERYISLLGGRIDAGPAFTFPRIASPTDTVTVDTLASLERHFRGWTASEIPERSPIVAITDGGYAVSVCFCARRTDMAAEAGVETAERFRGRGLAARVTAAWASAIRASGRLPLYSTSWHNESSLAVARKLNLELSASNWSLSD